MAYQVQVLPTEMFGNSAKVEISIPTTGMHFIFVRHFGGEERLRISLKNVFIKSL